VAARILQSKKKSPAHYRINGVRELTGGRKTEMELSPRLEKIIEQKDDDGNLSTVDVNFKGEAIKDLSENGKKAVVEFAASSYAVLENEQECLIMIEKYGNTEQECTVRYEIKKK